MDTKPKFNTNNGIDLNVRNTSINEAKPLYEDATPASTPQPIATMKDTAETNIPNKPISETVTSNEAIETTVFLNPDENVKEVDPDGPTIDAVILPASTYSDIYTAMKLMDEFEDDFTDDYSAKEALAVGIAADGARVTIKNNALVKTLKDKEADWVQAPKYADKVLGIRELAVGKGGSGNVKGSAAAAKFYSYLGLGGIIQIPLWHSGFWISLKTIKETDLLNLEMAIAENQIRLGRETNTLIYSNYSVVFNRLVMEFITRHIQSCTLDIDDINEISNHIMIQDLYPLVNGLIQSIYIKGFKDVRACINTLNINEVTKKPECDFTMESIIDPKKLLWVNRKALSSEHMKHMSKRAPKSVGIDEVIEYRSTLSVLKDKQYNIGTESGRDIILNIKNPTIKHHIESGERWVNDIITLTEKLFTDDLSADEKNKRVNASSKMVLLGTYNHFIKSLDLPDGTTVTDKKTMDSILEILVSDSVAFKNMIGAFKDYIDINTIAIVGIPKFRCPNCNTRQGSDSENEAFKDIIPINVLEAFFDLSILKTSKINERELSVDI